MLILIEILLILVPISVILYPFFQRQHWAYTPKSDSENYAELSRRLEEAIIALQNAELDLNLGYLQKDDYESLKENYMTEAAQLMKTIDHQKLTVEGIHDSTIVVTSTKD